MSQEALATFLGDKDFCIPKARDHLPPRSLAEDLTNTSPRGISVLKDSESSTVESYKNSAEDDQSDRIGRKHSELSRKYVVRVESARWL